MKKILLHIVLFFCIAQQLHSQDNGVVAFDIPARNSMKFNRFIFNPTFSFVREANRYISLNNKRQWSQFDDNPETYLFSYSGRLNENMGAGLGLYQQKIGIISNFGGVLNYAYNVAFDRDSNLTFGLNAGFYISTIDDSRVVTNFPDPSLSNIEGNSLIIVNPAINYGIGLLDFGVSVNNAVLYNLNTSELIEDNPEQSIQAHAMYTGYLDNGGFFGNSKFSALLRSEFKQDDTVLSGLMLLSVPKGIWAQAGYNTLYGVTGGLGINITPNIAIEYNFEKSIGDLIDFGNSHDITLAYRFTTRERYSYNDEDDEVALLTSSSFKKKKRPKRSKTSTLSATKKAEIEERRAKIEAEKIAGQQAEQDSIDNAQALAKEQEAIRIAQEAEAAKLREQQAAEAEAKKASQLEAERESKLAQEQAQREKAAKTAEENKRKAEAEKVRIAEQAKQRAAKAEEARQAQEAKLKAEAEETARLEQEARAQEEAIKIAEAKEKERLAIEEAARLEAEAKAVEQAKKDAEAKAVAEEEARRIAEEQKLQREAEEKERLAEEAAKQQALAEREQQEAQARLQAKLDAEDKVAQNLKKLTETSNEIDEKQDDLLDDLKDKIAVKRKDLQDLKKENDLGDQGIYTEPKPFKSVSAENKAMNALKLQLENTIKTQNKRIEDLEELYEERLSDVPSELDEVNLYYRKSIEKLKANQARAINTKMQLETTLSEIEVATEFERKRRIKRAAYDNETDRYNKDRAALKNLLNSTPISNSAFKPEDFNYGDTKNDIQILKNVSNVDKGYYMVIAVHENSADRNEFLKKVIASGRRDINFFYDVKTSKYYIYYEQYKYINQAEEALQAKGDRPYNGKMSIVKIEN